MLCVITGMLCVALLVQHAPGLRRSPHLTNISCTAPQMDNRVKSCWSNRRHMARRAIWLVISLQAVGHPWPWSVLVLRVGAVENTQHSTKVPLNCSYVCFLEKKTQGFFLYFAAYRAFMKTDKGQICYFPSEKVKGLFFFSSPADWRLNHHSQAAVGDGVRSSVPRFTFKWNQMAVHSEMIYSNDDGNKSKVLFPALAWDCCHSGLCRYSWWVISLLCQDYYLHISTSRFISGLPRRLNAVSNQPCSSLAAARCFTMSGFF